MTRSGATVAPDEPIGRRAYVESYRRPLAAILNPLAAAGWSLERIVEPRPQEEMRAVAEKDYLELARSPAFICVRARRG